ncbi:hypothetical protein HS3_03169 [Bacillus subtilis]|nr:hypothetical protein BSSC8_31810 [Bacillus subtilis subsp. subtilis str. SC-8]RAP06476.1 hypothetical protein HS3_03169 [Bacillus subtilis]
MTRKILNKNEYHICDKISPNQKKADLLLSENIQRDLLFMILT